MRDTWRALWLSRLLVWGAGVGTVLAFGVGTRAGRLQSPGADARVRDSGDLLAAPAARWDASWYLVIAHYGYRPDLGAFTASRAAFFPLYPLGLRGLSDVGLPPVLAGVALSVAALAAALYGIHRLHRTLESSAASRGGPPGRGAAGGAADGVRADGVLPLRGLLRVALPGAVGGPLLVRAPGALGVGGGAGGARGRDALAGVLLLVPALILYLYGPREDRPPDFPRRARLAARATACAPDVAVAGAVPLGVAAYMAYLALAGGDALLPFHAQEVWNRHFAGPFLGVWDGARAAFDGGAPAALRPAPARVLHRRPAATRSVAAGHNLMLFAFLLAAAPDARGRAAPPAAGVRRVCAGGAGAAALLPGAPAAADVAAALPGGAVPAGMCWGPPGAQAPRAPVGGGAGLGAAGMVFFAAQFATWHWVASEAARRCSASEARGDAADGLGTLLALEPPVRRWRRG